MESVNGIYSKNNQKEFGRLLGEVKPMYRDIWEIGIMTGLRVSDILRLERKDFESKELEVKEQKTGKVRKFIFPDKFRMRIVREYESGKLFPVSRQYVHKVMRRIGCCMGLISIGTHSMRKTYAYNLLLKLGQFRGVQEALKHTYMSTTFEYVRDGVEKALPKLSSGIIRPLEIIDGVED